MLLAGGVLAALVLVGVPIWLHRMRRFEGERRIFASLRLMPADDLAPRSEPKLRHLLLMALRIGVIAAAVLAFARPAFERSPVSGTSVVPRLIVVDTSFSMGARGVLDEARAAAAEIAAGADGAVSLSTASGTELELRVRGGTSADVRGVFSRLRADDTRLAFAVLSTQIAAAAEAVAEGGPLEVHLISDFQQSGMPEQFNRLVQQASWRLVLHRVGGQVLDNMAIESLSVADAADGREMDVRVGVRAFGEVTGSAELEIRTGDEVTRLPITMSRELTYHTTRVPKGGTVLATIDRPGTLEGDEVRRLARHVQERRVAVVVAGDAEGAGARFLTTAFESVGAAALQTVGPDEIDAVAGHALVAIDPNGWSQAAVRELRDRVRDGASVFVTAGGAARRAGQLAFPPLALSSTRLAETRSPVVAVDPTHPLLSGLNGSGDTEVYQRVFPTSNDAGRVLLETEDARPFLVEYPVGAGRALVMMAALDPAWSSFVVDAAFVRFAENLLQYVAGGVLPAAVDAGAPLRIDAAALQIFDAQGTRMLGLSEMSGQRRVRLETAGFYHVHAAGSKRTLAVNVPTGESDLRPASRELLDRWEAAQSGSDVVGKAIDTAGYWELAPWLLALLAMLAVLEAAFANMTARAGIGAQPVHNEPQFSGSV